MFRLEFSVTQKNSASITRDQDERKGGQQVLNDNFFSLQTKKMFLELSEFLES